METVQLNLSENQISKLRNGKNIQIKPEQMGSGMNFRLNANNMKKLRSGYNKAKAIRMAMNDEEVEGSGIGLKNIRNGLKKVTHVANKVNNALHDEDLQRKILTTSRKIKNTVNKGQVIGDLGIPGVSAGYNLINEAVNDGDRLVRKGVKAKSKLVADFDNINNEYKTGSGNNPYLPTKKKIKGGSFKTLGGNMKLQTDHSISIRPDNPSFNPLKLKTYNQVMHGGSMSSKCDYCNR
jgi:hypothetical protein